jgi:hypothetical protein
MNINFQSALDYLRRVAGDNFEVEIANAARPDSDYLFEQVFPERLIDDYMASNAAMTIKSTMAGLVGMDSPLPPVGAASSRTWTQETFKIGGMFTFPEQVLRHLQMQAMRIRAGGGDDTQAIADRIINFAKFLRQPLLDTAEFLRGMALMTGGIDWTFNQKRVEVSYGVPAGNLIAERTGTAGYGGSASVFWADWYAARTLLNGRIRVVFATPATIAMITGNSVNSVRILTDDERGSASFVRLSNPSMDVASSDRRDRVSMVAYDASGNVFDLSSAGLGLVVQVPFLSDGYVIIVGGGSASGQAFSVDSTGDEARDTRGVELGYTHIGPTVEGGSVGRWERIFTPENRPYQLQGEAAMNLVPVMTGPENLVVLRTVMV